MEYSPWGWKNKTVNIYRITSTGKRN